VHLDRVYLTWLNDEHGTCYVALCLSLLRPFSSLRVLNYFPLSFNVLFLVSYLISFIASLLHYSTP
jgi:hypothetical protein